MLAKISARLEKKIRLSKNIFLFGFALLSPQKFFFAAGQYVILRVPGPTNQLIPRLYSIASKDGDVDVFELIIEPVPGGVASNYFDRLRVGDIVDFQGPAGLFTLKKTGRPVVFLATGSGIAPARSIILSNIDTDNRPYFLFWGLQTKDCMCFTDELGELAKNHANFKFFYCLSREATLTPTNCLISGRVNAGLEKILKTPTAADFYLSGGRTVVESLKSYLLSANVPPEAIFFERF